MHVLLITEFSRVHLSLSVKKKLDIASLILIAGVTNYYLPLAESLVEFLHCYMPVHVFDADGTGDTVDGVLSSSTEDGVVNSGKRR